MSKENIITAIDVGTDKCVTLIATCPPSSPELRVVGVATVPSLGVKKSSIVDLEAVLGSIEQSLNAAERMAGFSVSSAYVSVGGTQIESMNSKGVVAVANPDQEIVASDVNRVIEAARAVSIPSDRQIIHVIPRYYKVDSQAGIKDPVGMTGVRLESEAHIITGMSTSLKNLQKCINDLGINVDGFVFAGLAAAEVTLTETEKELGVVAFDIGAGTSSFCVYADGALKFSGSLPIGARHLTQDIALGCRISLDAAEKVKLALSQNLCQELKPIPGESKKDYNLRKKKADELDLEKLGINENVDCLSQLTIVKRIMAPRIEEIVEMLATKLQDKELINEVPAGVVISGGGANTIGLVEITKNMLRLPARIGTPSKISGLVGEITGPSFASSVGLLAYGQRQGGGSQAKAPGIGEFFKDFQPQKIGTKLLTLLKSLLP